MGFLFITAQQTEKLIVPDSIQKAKFAETVEKIANMDLEKVLTNLVSESIWVGLKIVLALAIYMAGRWLIGRLIKLLSTAFEKRKVDRSLQIFLRNLIKTISYIVLILLIIQVMGINTTSIVALLASAGLAIGMALSGTLQNFAGGVMILLLKPYRMEVVQGNVVTQEVMAQIQPGLGRNQVRDILGTPLVASLFHADRWDYVFTLKRPGEDVQTRKLVVTFEGEHFVRAEGDEMPTEAEFVASLGVRTRSSKVPPLQATPEQLARYPAPSQPAASSAAATPAADSGAPRTSYPPLE